MCTKIRGKLHEYDIYVKNFTKIMDICCILSTKIKEKSKVDKRYGSVVKSTVELLKWRIMPSKEDTDGFYKEYSRD